MHEAEREDVEATTSTGGEMMSKMVSFRMEEDEKLTLEILTNQLKRKFGNAFTRSEVIKLGLVLLEELGLENLEMVVNGGNLEISVKQGGKDE